jgi:hypothetical protein
MNADPEQFHDLFDAHVRYMQALSASTGHSYPPFNFADFINWWKQLSPPVRARFEQNYLRGYAATIEVGQKRIAEAVFAGRS